MRSTASVAVLALAAACLVPGCGPGSPRSTPAPAPPPPPPPVLRLSPSGLKLYDQVSGTTQRLQAVSAVDDKVVWASGTGGTFALTRDGGQT
ncbi:MAG TPA: hypothetical protein VNH46_08905, partial [Gemmatimonadales bacterium]|nr:hypothetical protein [Gemmatimonadales bacterium]